MKSNAGRKPLPEGWKRIYFNASPELQAYYHRVRRAQKLGTRGDVLRLISNDAMTHDRFLTSIDANVATEQQP